MDGEVQLNVSPLGTFQEPNAMPVRMGRGFLAPPERENFSWKADYCDASMVTFSITWLRLKVPGFWRGGNSLKLWSHAAT